MKKIIFRFLILLTIYFTIQSCVDELFLIHYGSVGFENDWLKITESENVILRYSAFKFSPIPIPGGFGGSDILIEMPKTYLIEDLQYDLKDEQITAYHLADWHHCLLPDGEVKGKFKIITIDEFSITAEFDLKVILDYENEEFKGIYKFEFVKDETDSADDKK